MNGKGDKNRVTNFSKFRDNYDNIFKKNKKPRKKPLTKPKKNS